MFSLYSLTALAMLKSWVTNEARWRYAALSGLLLGMLVLARTAYVVLAPVLLMLDLLRGSGCGTAGARRCRQCSPSPRAS